MTFGLVGGCMMIDREPSTNAPQVWNFSDGSIQVSIERGGRRTPVTTINGGNGAYLVGFEGACTDGTLIAMGPAGNEEGRRTEPLCPGETWSIGRPALETRP